VNEVLRLRSSNDVEDHVELISRLVGVSTLLLVLLTWGEREARLAREERSSFLKVIDVLFHHVK
jgi:hypothetical protein